MKEQTPMRRFITPKMVIAVGSIIVALLLILLGQSLASRARLPGRLDVKSVKPSDGATKVALDTPITVEFANAIVDAKTLAAAADHAG
jgi:hypothetical protein